MFAMRGNNDGRNMMRNILLGQGAGIVANSFLDMFEPQTRKKEEDRDAGDKTRDFLRNMVNTGVAANYAYQTFRMLQPDSAQTQGSADSGSEQKYLPPGRSYGTGGSSGGPNNTPPPTSPTSPGAGGVNLAKQDLGGASGDGPADNAFGQAVMRQSQMLGAEAAVEAAANQPAMPGAFQRLDENTLVRNAETGTGSLMERQKQAEDFTRSARSERMPGVMRDLNQQVDADMAQRLAGLEKEAAAYPKQQERDYKAEGIAAGNQFNAMRNQGEVGPQNDDPTPPVAYTSTPAVVSSNPLLRREPASSFAEEFGRKEGKISREESAKLKDESLGKFYGNMPADPETGERLSAFLQGYQEGRGAVQPRSHGALLSDQLEGQTSFDQQQSRVGFVQEAQADALNTMDDQGPDRPATRAMGQKEDYMMEMLGRLGQQQQEMQAQLKEMKGSTFVPTADNAGEYVKSDFLVPARKDAPEPSQPAPVTEAAPSPSRRVTIIEETTPEIKSFDPLNVSEQLRRIQTSGRPNARQEAQDFLANVRSKMNG